MVLAKDYEELKDCLVPCAGENWPDEWPLYTEGLRLICASECWRPLEINCQNKQWIC